MRPLESDFITLNNQNGLVGRFSTLGAGVNALTLDGKPIILQFKEDADYLASSGYHGKTLGRIAGRIPDEFVLNGKYYRVPGDENHICLHGGMEDSLSYQNFQATQEEDEKETRLIFTYLSKDGEAGFPGNLEVKVIYAFLKGEENILEIRYEATSDKDTFLAMSNHMYFNIFSSLNVNDYYLQVKASKMGIFKPGSQLVVGLSDVEDCFDFREPALLKEKLDLIEKNHPEVGTLDHTLIFDQTSNPKVVLENQDLRIEVDTDFDSVNFYVDTSLLPFRFVNKEELTTSTRRAIAVEPESCPMMSNITLKAGEKYSHFMRYHFIKK